MNCDRRSFLSGLAAASLPVPLVLGLSQPLHSHETNAAHGFVQDLVTRERNAILRLVESGIVDGVAVGLRYKGVSVWTEGFGKTDVCGRATDTDTIFSIQSTSKNLTAVAILLAVQQGVLDLDTPLNELLPAFTVNSRFQPHPERVITLRLLLSHRAGFTHEAPIGNNYEPEFENFEAHVESIAKTWLRFPVGDRYRYSNLGFDLAGYVLQKKTGMRFEDWAKKMLFDPLDMRTATYDSEMFTANQNRAIGHAAGYSSVPLRTPLIPSGGVYVSSEDMQKFAAFHLGKGASNGQRVLKRELWDEMHDFGLGGDYGLGIIREEQRYGEAPLRILSHKGGGFGFGSVFVYCPEAGLSWFAMFNRAADEGYRLGRDLIRELLVRQYGMFSPRLTSNSLATIKPPSGTLGSFVGHYTGRGMGATISEAPGGLQKLEEGTSSPVSFISPTTIFTVQANHGVRIYEYTPPSPLLPAHLECTEGELSLDFDGDLPGSPQIDAVRQKRINGEYVVDQWGKPALQVRITTVGRRLHLNGTSVICEPEPNLFFLSDGEALDFRSDPPKWKNLILRRVA